MPLRIDQMGRRVEVPDNPQRIVSLVPSQTELLYDLGMEGKIVGQTLFCIHPKKYFKTARKIGGTKKLNLETIRNLNPDLIIGNKEENEAAQILELEKDFPVWMSDIFNLSDAIEMIRELGEICKVSSRSTLLLAEIDKGFSTLNNHSKPGGRVLYFIWRKPYMVAGMNTFIHDMLQRCGYENAIQDPISRYPELSKEQIISLNPDYLFLSSEPYPFKEKHIAELADLYPSAHIQMVDGEMFTWYGSRLAKAPLYFHNLINSML